MGAPTAALLFSVTAAFGEQADAISLLRQCEGEEPQGAGEIGQIACASYLSGVLDMLSFWHSALPENSPACLPDQGISNEQAMLIFTKWAQDRPENPGKPPYWGLGFRRGYYPAGREGLSRARKRPIHAQESEGSKRTA